VQDRELELQLAEALDRIALIESEIERLKHPPQFEWMSPAQIEDYSKGKYPARLVREKIQMAIDRPEDSPLRLGEHYTIDSDDRGRVIRVNYPQFDRLMIQAMRANVFA
jgi:hypothetical protein